MMNSLTIAALLSSTRKTLHACVDDAEYEAKLLLSHAMRVTQTYLYTHPEVLVSKRVLDTLQDWLSRRCAGEPVAYILQHRYFWTLRLRVTPDTLIPRPDTEHLVEAVCSCLPPHSPCVVADLGTGSGAIALALAQERPLWQLYATDRCPKALAVAQENAIHHGLCHVEFSCGDWYAALPLGLLCDAIVSNPPYVAEQDPHLVQGDLRFEPDIALVSAEEGMADLRYLIAHALAYLKPKGFLFLEHGAQQKELVAAELRRAGFRAITHYRDYSGCDRLVRAARE